MGTPSAQTLDDVGVEKMFQELEEVPMTIVGGLDVHRQQITFDYVDDDGLVRWGQIRPATRKTLRGWLAEHCPDGDGEFALEGCTGWRYVSEELAAAGLGVHLGDPAEIAVLRGPKKRAKTDRADARLLRTLLLEGRFPESWIPPAHVAEIRSLGRLYYTLMDERRAWQQRIHAQLFHQGCPPIKALLSAAGREALARAQLSAAGRQYVDTALRRIDELSAEIEPLRAQLVNFARRQQGCQALQRHYGIGWLCAAIIWAEIGDARRFRVPISWCGLPGWTSPSTPPIPNAHQGICPAKAHPSCGGWRLRRPGVRPGAVLPITPTTTGKRPSMRATTARTRPWRWSAKFCVAAITPCVTWAMPPWRGSEALSLVGPSAQCARGVLPVTRGPSLVRRQYLAGLVLRQGPSPPMSPF